VAQHGPENPIIINDWEDNEREMDDDEYFPPPGLLVEIQDNKVGGNPPAYVC